MNSKILVVFSVLLLSLGLIGCSGSSDDKESKSLTAQEKAAFKSVTKFNK